MPAFDIQKFRKLKSFRDRYDYLSGTDVDRIGEGAGREVFDTKRGYVIKVATNRFGVQETLREIERSRCIQRAGSKSLVPFLVCSDDGSWIAAKKVKALSSDDHFGDLIKKQCGITGIEFNAITQDMWEDGNLKKDPDLKGKHRKLYHSNGWYKSVIDAIMKCGLDPTDLHPGNWGLDDAGNLVMIDIGYG